MTDGSKRKRKVGMGSSIYLTNTFKISGVVIKNENFWIYPWKQIRIIEDEASEFAS